MASGHIAKLLLLLVIFISLCVISKLRNNRTSRNTSFHLTVQILNVEQDFPITGLCVHLENSAGEKMQASPARKHFVSLLQLLREDAVGMDQVREGAGQDRT